MTVKVNKQEEFDAKWREMKKKEYVCKHFNYECMMNAPAMDFVRIKFGQEILEQRVVLCKECRLCR